MRPRLRAERGTQGRRRCRDQQLVRLRRPQRLCRDSKAPRITALRCQTPIPVSDTPPRLSPLCNRSSWWCAARGARADGRSTCRGARPRASPCPRGCRTQRSTACCTTTATGSRPSAHGSVRAYGSIRAASPSSRAGAPRASSPRCSSRIQIRDQRTRWGSCSANGNLSFNWRLVLAPIEVLDYVVVHEVCHLREANHSRRFWRLVETRRPDWRDQKAWLDAHGPELLAFRPAA
ncbi:MAG: M48 family metallopeptidase [Actinobacteria bacterium]|nr:MAG: M48 family metallopeptidase [Actinomycetota bacterium]